MQANKAADLHTPSFNQRVVAAILKAGFIERHVPSIRALYKRQCQTMLEALEHEMTGLGMHWSRPEGGMFLWARLPADIDAMALWSRAVEKGVAFVPGSAFHTRPEEAGVAQTMRLSFVTASEAQIRSGIALLGQVIREMKTRTPMADSALQH